MDYRYFPGIPDTSRAVIKSRIPGEFKRKVKINTIIKTVCNYFDLDEEKVCSNLREKDYVNARHWIIYLSTGATNMSLVTIGKRFNKHHATVIYIRKTMQDRISIYQEDREIYENLKSKIDD